MRGRRSSIGETAYCTPRLAAADLLPRGMASSELLSWESLVRAGRLSRALDKEDPVNAPALRKLRISGLLPAAEPYTLRIWMP